MRAIVLFALAHAVLSACTDDPARYDGPPVESYVATWEIPGQSLPQLDVLLVVDDTTAFAPYRDNLASVPGALEKVLRAPDGQDQLAADLRIAVVTSDGSGALRTSSAVDGDYIIDRYHYDGTRETNYRGSLADAIASLLPTTAARTTANRPLASMPAALTTRWLRPYSTVTILSVSGSDDVSPSAPSIYADAIKATRGDWYRISVAGAFPKGSPTLDAFYLMFSPYRSKTADIATVDYTSSELLLPLVGGWDRDPICTDAWLDLDPATPGDQVDCSFSSFIDGVESVIAPCSSGATPCWELTEPMWCEYATKRLVFRGYPGDAWPTIRGQCVAL